MGRECFSGFFVDNFLGLMIINLGNDIQFYSK